MVMYLSNGTLQVSLGSHHHTLGVAVPCSRNNYIIIISDIILSQFHDHAQYVQAACLASHSSCKHGGLQE